MEPLEMEVPDFDRGIKEKTKEKTKTKMLQLFEHPRRSFISLNKTYQGFKVTQDVPKGERYSGITSHLAKCFWPNYEFKRTKYNGGTGVNNTQEGIDRGKKVHEQIEDWINKEFDIFKQKHPVLHEHTIKIMNATKEWGIRPTIAEFCIYDESRKIATAIDACCVDKKTGEFIIVDWKIGFDDYELKGNGEIKGPKSLEKLGLSNAPIMQGFIQLLIESEILKRRYGIEPDKALVIQASLKGVKKHEIPYELWRIRSDIYDYFIEYLDKLNKEKLEKRKYVPKKRVKKGKSDEEYPKSKSKSKKEEKKSFFGPKSKKEETKETEKKPKITIKRKKTNGKEEKDRKTKSSNKKRKVIHPDLVGIGFPED